MTRLTVELIERMRDAAPVIAVVGDLILDGWWQGRSERMSREAPVPIVEIADRTYRPGGAANTAVNLAALGARVRLCGIVGDDADGHRLLALLEECGVDTSHVLVSSAVSTVTKTRISGSDQVLVRLDDVPRDGYPRDARERLAALAVAVTTDADAEVVCDYASGALAGPVADALAARAERPRLTVVDAHDLRRWAPLKPDLVTPNAAEAERLVDIDLRVDARRDRIGIVSNAAGELIAASAATDVIVTLDRDGAVLLGSDGVRHRTWAHPTPEARASGAGDTFVAAATIGRASGLPLELCLDLAQAAADIVVQRPGTSVCSSMDLAERIGSARDLTIAAAALEAELDAHRRAGRRIVFTNGCFDVLHRGHTGYLRQASLLGDVLVVGLNDDDSVRRLKGPTRPVNRASDRATVLAALECVDYVTVFETDTPIPLIERFHPEVYAKGGDYTPEMLEESGVVRGYGGQVVILDYLPSQSTTAIVERIRATSAPQADAVADT